MNIIDLTDDEYFMNAALKQAAAAYGEGEVPVGAVAVLNGEIIAKAYNQVERLKDATAHAEMLLLTKISSYIGDWRFNKVTVYVTKEPCSMCAGAMVNCRLGKLVYGIYDKKYGAAGSAVDILNLQGSLHKVPAVGGILHNQCLELFQDFFKGLRR